MNAPAEMPADSTTLVIESGRSDAHYWRDLWRFRELLGFLAWRDVKVRYKQTALGAIWALVQPIVTTGIFTLIFGKVARLEEQVTVPFSLFVLSGVLPWQLFAAALSNSSASLIGNSHLISKIYFPRLVIPLSTLAVALVDFGVVLVLYVLMSAWFGIFPNWHWLLLPLMMLLALLVALGAGLWLTALTVKFRDFRYIVPFLLQVGLFLSPIGIRPEFAPNWASLLALNPMTGVIDGFRWCLLPEDVPLDPVRLLISVVMGLGLLIGGLWYFRRTERSFADVI
jgi:lipopolysaccharide transport system permease protein